MDEGHRKAGPLEAMRAVLSAFIGVRRRAEHDKIHVTPLQIIVAAVLAAALFVLGLVTVVRLVVR